MDRQMDGQTDRQIITQTMFDTQLNLTKVN